MNRLILGKNNSLNVLIIKFFDAVKKKLSKLQAEEFDNLVDGLNKNSDIEDLTTTYLNVKSLLNDIDIQMNTSKIDSALQSRGLIEQPNVVLTADDIICQYTNGTKTYLIYNTSDLVIAKDEDDLSNNIWSAQNDDLQAAFQQVEAAIIEILETSDDTEFERVIRTTDDTIDFNTTAWNNYINSFKDSESSDDDNEDDLDDSNNDSDDSNENVSRTLERDRIKNNTHKQYEVDIIFNDKDIDIIHQFTASFAKQNNVVDFYFSNTNTTAKTRFRLKYAYAFNAVDSIVKELIPDSRLLLAATYYSSNDDVTAIVYELNNQFIVFGSTAEIDLMNAQVIMEDLDNQTDVNLVKVRKDLVDRDTDPAFFNDDIAINMLQYLVNTSRTITVFDSFNEADSYINNNNIVESATSDLYKPTTNVQESKDQILHIIFYFQFIKQLLSWLKSNYTIIKNFDELNTQLNTWYTKYERNKGNDV